MERQTIKAESREVGKKGGNRRLRASGFIPAVLYGRGSGGVGLAVHAKTVTLSLRAQGTNALYDLEVNGSKEPVLVKDYQIDALTQKLTHLDFLKIDAHEKISIKVPIKIVGKAAGIAEGGILDLLRRDIDVKCTADHIPENIEIDVTSLELGRVLHVNEITFPKGVEIPANAKYPLISITVPKEEKGPEVAVAATDAAATPAAPAAGAPAAGAAPAAAAPAAKKDAKK